MDNLLISGGHNVERKWGLVICGLVMYKVLIGCGENVGFLTINCPHFLGPAKVKQHRFFVSSFDRSHRRLREREGNEIETVIRKFDVAGISEPAMPANRS